MKLTTAFILFTTALAASPSATQSPARDLDRTVQSGGRSRSYLLHVPPGARGEPLPLVLAFHGGATNARSMSRLAGLNDLADRERFLVAYPNGTGRLPSVLTWNAGRCCGYAVEQRVDDVAFVRTMLEDIGQVTPVDATRVFATGISNGGQMAYRLAIEMPDRIAAIAPVAASLEVTPSTLPRPVPVVHFHGTDDEHLPMAGGRGRRSIGGVDFAGVVTSIGTWVQANACGRLPSTASLPDTVKDGTTVARWTYQGCTANAEVILYVIAGGGHTWPGHPIADRLLGLTTRDIDATALMWEFFKRHPRNPGVRR